MQNCSGESILFDHAKQFHAWHRQITLRILCNYLDMLAEEDYLTKPEIFAKYPETLTFDQFDSIKWDFEQQFGLDDPRANNEILKEAFALIKKKNHNYVLYTQVDGDSGDRIYDKGNHLVNRTGIWWVVKSKDVENTPFMGGKKDDVY